MHVIRLVDNMNGSQPELSVVKEPVLVESGCTCRLNPEPLIASGNTIAVSLPLYTLFLVFTVLKIKYRVTNMDGNFFKY